MKSTDGFQASVLPFLDRPWVDLGMTRTRLSAPVEFEVLEYKVILAWPNSASISPAVIVRYQVYTYTHYNNYSKVEFNACVSVTM